MSPAISGVISLRTEQDICRVAQTCEVEFEGAATYSPWDELVVIINDTRLFTGYIEEVIVHSDGSSTVRGKDRMKRALDMFVTDEVRVEEEKDAGWWIAYWLSEAGIPNSGSVETGKTIPLTLPEETGWQYISISDVILECLGYAGGGYTVIVDSEGVAQIREKTIGASGHALSNLLAFSRSQDDSWYRDRAVVFGTTSGSWVEGEWVLGEFTVVAEAGSGNRTAVLSSSYIQSQSAAEDLADDILDFFDEYLDVKRCLIVGISGIWLGDSASVSESWSGYSGTGLVTSIETTVDDSGFRQLVSLDEKCGFIWGHGQPYGQIMLAVPGTLSVKDDVAPWLICDIPIGITLLSTKAGVKTPSTGAIIYYELETSTDGITWTYIHTNGIGAGAYLSPEGTTFVEDPMFIEKNTIVRLNVTQIGSTIAGADLTVAVRVKIGEV